jgi:hypothetical protein
MAWFRSGAEPWSGFPGYEEIAEKLLRQYQTTELIRAVENRNLTSQELEGAARILGGWTPVREQNPDPHGVAAVPAESWPREFRSGQGGAP